MSTIEKEVQNIIKWLNDLPKYRKTIEMLGKKDGDGKWSYCCLGVGCRVTDTRNVNFSDGSDDRLMDKLCLKSGEGRFLRTIKVNGVFINSLTGMNDNVFGKDKDFTNQRKGMLLTLDLWIADENVLNAVKEHFADEIEQIKKEPGFSIDWIAARGNINC